MLCRHPLSSAGCWGQWLSTGNCVRAELVQLQQQMRWLATLKILQFDKPLLCWQACNVVVCAAKLAMSQSVLPSLQYHLDSQYHACCRGQSSYHDDVVSLSPRAVVCGWCRVASLQNDVSPRGQSGVGQNIVRDHGLTVMVFCLESRQTCGVPHSTCAAGVPQDSLPVDFVVDGDL